MTKDDAMTPTRDDHHFWMAQALEQAQCAAAAGEVPVGAVVVYQGQAIAKAYNQTLQLADPTAHAEVLALRQAAQVLGNHRLNDCTLYVSLEPCAMCSGAVFQARLKAVVYGAQEAKTGAAGSVVDLFANRQLNHHTQIVGGVLAAEAGQLLADFFSQRRAAAKAQPSQRLSDAALRTPAAALAAAHWPEGRYTQDLPSTQGMRLHYLQHGLHEERASAAASVVGDEPLVWVLLHPLWHGSAWWQPLLAALAEQGEQVIAPDWIGWGRSDKPKRADWHSLQRHADVLLELLQSVGARRCVLVCQDGSQALAHSVSARLQQSAKTSAEVTAEVNTEGLQVHALVQLQCTGTTGLWPAPKGAAANKTWRVAAYLREQLRQVSRLPKAEIETLVATAAAPYPDAGHARNWAGQWWSEQGAAQPLFNCYQFEAHAQHDATQLAQQLRIMAQTWRAAGHEPAPNKQY